jgi:hypothetical protein
VFTNPGIPLGGRKSLTPWREPQRLWILKTGLGPKFRPADCSLVSYSSRIVSRSVMPESNPVVGPLSADAGSGVFAATNWSVVLAAGQREFTQAAEALEQFCRT